MDVRLETLQICWVPQQVEMAPSGLYQIPYHKVNGLIVNRTKSKSKCKCRKCLQKSHKKQMLCSQPKHFVDSLWCGSNHLEKSSQIFEQVQPLFCLQHLYELVVTMAPNSCLTGQSLCGIGLKHADVPKKEYISSFNLREIR